GRLASRGRRARSGPLLGLAGLFWGLAVQTHPSALGLLPGAANFLLLKAPAAGRLLTPRLTCLALALFLIANVNLLVYNAATGFGSLSGAARVAAEYGEYRRPSPELFGGRLRAVAISALENLGGSIDFRDHDEDYLLDPGLWPMMLVCLAGLIWQW